MTMTYDPRAIPASARARLDQMEAARQQRISALNDEAHKAHKARIESIQWRFVNGEDPYPRYRAAIERSEQQLAADLTNKPPKLDPAATAALVEARAALAMSEWWAAGLDAAQREQDAWTPATADATEEAPHAAA